MKILIFLSLAALTSARPEDDPSRHESMDFIKIVNNMPVLEMYSKCFLDDGPCPPKGDEIKQMIRSALAEGCSQCTEIQKVIVAKAIKAVMKELPEDSEKFRQIFNPTGQYDSIVNEFVQKYGN